MSAHIPLSQQRRNLTVSFPAGLPHLIMLRSGDAFFHQSFIIASAFAVLILAGSYLHFVPGRAGHLSRAKRTLPGA